MNQPGLFSKRPSTVEAWQWDGGPETAVLICDWIGSNGGFAEPHPYENHLILWGSEESAPVKPTDWVIRDKFGEFWPLGDDIFPGVYASLLEH